MNIKIEHWKPTLDKINWQSGWSVHKDGPAHHFISDIKSIRRNPSMGYTDGSPCTYCDASNERYWEMGFYEPIDESDKSKYFIMVNRRCVPDINSQGDFRELRVKLDSTQLSGFQNWKIIDLDSNKVVCTFNKDTSAYINFGEFKPGEGKLYKMAPVMQEGGTLVTDESLQGINFICNGEINNNGKNVYILDGTEIQFKTGASIKMSGGNFICDNNSSSANNNISLKGYSSQSWNGVSLTNTGPYTRIEKTSFEDTKSPIKIDNTQFPTQYNDKVIKKNYFKISSSDSKAIYIHNQLSLLVDSNEFDISNYSNTVAIYFVNNLNEGAEGASGPSEPAYSNVNITNNKFIGAYIPLLLHDLGSNYSNFYLYNNEFHNTGLHGIAGFKVSGVIKQNRFIDPSENSCIYLSLSNPDMYGNVLKSEKSNLVLMNSYPRLAPFRAANQLIWKGGRNSFETTNSSDTSENILLNTSRPETHLGKNTFEINNSYSYHIYGTLPTNLERIYRAVRNCWIGNGDYPKIFLYSLLDTPIVPYSYTYLPTSCIPEEYVQEVIADQGFGIPDTTFISDYDSTDILPEDETLLYQAEIAYELAEFPEAITHYKGLIDNFPTSDYIYDTEYDLYECYYALDTSQSDEITDILYCDLKLDFENKINSDNYDENFEDIAFQIILMSEVRLKNYNDALTGYEFISLYHPNAEQRMIASWEYANIEDLLQGMGGGEKDNYELGITNYESGNEESDLFKLVKESRTKKLDELVDKDPIKKHLKDQYKKTANEKIRNEKLTKDGISVRNFKVNETKVNERVRKNLYSSKNLSKEEKEKSQFEDMNLLLNPENVEVGKNDANNLIPLQYNLSQNYPNPFNPITKINFDLPEDGKTKLIVYDILGREVMRLVNNEFRSAGRYVVEFNGSNLSSGIYFYRLESNKFVQTKRMVLVK